MRRKKRTRAFKAVIMNKTSIKMTIFAFVFMLLIMCIFATANMALGAFKYANYNIISAAVMENMIPSWGSGDKQKELWYSVICKMVGFDIKTPATIIQNQIGAIKIGTKNERLKDAQNKKNEQKSEENEEGRYPIVETSSIIGSTTNTGENKAIYLNNETSFDIDINALLSEPLSIKKKDGPFVLIVHTHTTESYTPPDQNSYSPDESTRTQDTNYNVVRVGEIMAHELEAAGIETIHDKTINDYPSYSGSYKKTLGIIESYLKKYPSIQVVLDVHRDGMTKNDGTKMKVCADINGEKASQVMVLCGSSEGGLKHENWKENLKLGLRIQDALTKNYPGLARPLHFVKERYNQHATKGSMILEVGTDGNTLDEALVCAKYTARAIADVLGKIQ